MTDAEFEAFVAQARAEVDAELARLEAIDPSTLSANERVMVQRHQRECIELRDSMTDDELRAELEANEHAGRDLTPNEVAAIRRRQ